VLQPPGGGLFWEGHDDGCVQIWDETFFDLRAVGFSPKGTALVVASSGEFRLFTR
jgi:hypothetical protein